MKNFLFNFMSQHKERFISVAFGIGTLAVSYLFNAPTYISALTSAGMMKSTRLQIALLLSGEAIGYLCGVPLPLLIAAPFIMAPTLLQTIKNYAYLAIPLGIMAFQINKDPAQYLIGHVFNLAAIGGLLLGKKIISARMTTSQSVIENELSIEDDSQEQLCLQVNPEPEPVLFQHASCSKAKPRKKNVSEDSDYESSYTPSGQGHIYGLSHLKK